MFALFITKALDLLQRAAEVIGAIALFVMVVLGILAVLFRFVIESALDFPEPAMLLLFVWTMCLGAFIGFRQNMHPAIDTLQQKLPRPLAKGAEWIGMIVSAGFFWVLLRYGWAYTERTLPQISPTLSISMAWLNAAVPVMAALLLLCLAENLLSPRRAPIPAAD